VEDILSGRDEKYRGTAYLLDDKKMASGGAGGASGGGSAPGSGTVTPSGHYGVASGTSMRTPKPNQKRLP